MNRKITQRELHKLINEIVTRARSLNEGATERDNYTGGSDTYAIENAQGLIALLTDEKYVIAPGTFASLTYIKKAELNKGYNKDGYTDSSGNYTSFDDIEAQGRALNKKYINDLYDSDKYQSRDFRQRVGLQSDFVTLEVTQTEINWGAMTYNENKKQREDAIRNATQDVVDQYTKMDPDFNKRLAAYCKNHSIEQEEIEAMRDQGVLDRQTVIEIFKTPIVSRVSNWQKENDTVSKNTQTNTYGLRMTQTAAQSARANNEYFIVRNGQVLKISRDEYFHIRKMFARPHKSTEVAHTELGDMLAAITGSCHFRDRDIKGIVKLSFTLQHVKTGQKKNFTYVNNEIAIPGTSAGSPIVLRADELLNSPMAEGRNRSATTAPRATCAWRKRLIESICRELTESRTNKPGARLRISNRNTR